MKVHELITMLQQYDASAEVTVTWEGTTQTPNVYQAADRRVMIDADNNDYKLKWQQIKCEVCGEIANLQKICFNAINQNVRSIGP